MAFLSKPVYCVDEAKGWQPKHREHPVIDWMFAYEQAFDFGDMKAGGPDPWMADDVVFTHPSSKVYKGKQEAWEGVLGMYAPFAAHYHEPQHYIIWETDEGFKLTGLAKMYTNLPVPGEKKCKDLEGREWDCVGNGGFSFEYVKDPSGPKGLKLKSQTVCPDPLGMMSEMIDRKMATADDLFAMHKKVVS